jgi:hypothetical protein
LSRTAPRTSAATRASCCNVKKLGRIRGGAGAPVATAAWPTWRARRQLDHVHVCIDIPLRGRDAFFGIQGGRV